MKQIVIVLLMPIAPGPGPGGGGGGGGTAFCSTDMGAFLEGITSALGVIALAAILIAILLGVAARPFIRSVSQASALNNIVEKGFMGLLILVLAIPAITWGLSFTSFSPVLKCIPFI